MDLLEYQAKEWFREMGIPVLPSQRIDRPSDPGLKIPYPVVLNPKFALVDVAEQVGLSLWKTRLMRSLPLRQFFPADPRV